MYDYREAMREDLTNGLESGDFDCYFEDLEEGFDAVDVNDALYDELFLEDSITGNASGSYTFNCCKAAEYVNDNIDLLNELVEAGWEDVASIGRKFLDEDFESFDVSIRCYILSDVLSEWIREDFEEIENYINNLHGWTDGE